MARSVLVGASYSTVKAHERSSPSDQFDVRGNLKSAKRQHRRRSRKRSNQLGISIPKRY